MASARLIGKDQAHSKALAAIDALEQRMAHNITTIVVEVDAMVKSLTPVNTGQAVRNYIWSRGEPNLIVFPAINNGPPGPTNSMALGTEPRRHVNEAAAALSIATLDLGNNPFGVIYLSNVSPDIIGLELGLLPGPPLKSRSPQGMFGITSAFVATQIATRGFTK